MCNPRVVLLPLELAIRGALAFAFASACALPLVLWLALLVPENAEVSGVRRATAGTVGVIIAVLAGYIWHRVTWIPGSVRGGRGQRVRMDLVQ